MAVRILMYNINEVVQLEAALYQGFANKLAVMEILTALITAESEALSIPSGMNIPEPTLGSFVGVSMGGILGSGYIAVANYSRASLLVAGSPFTYIIPRSSLFVVYIGLMDLQFFDRRDIRIALTSMQIMMDPFESSGWAETGSYDNAEVLVQISQGDSTVTPDGSAILSRNIKASNLDPSVQIIYGLPNESLPIFPKSSGAYLMEAIYPGDAALVNADYTSIPPDTEVHNCFPFRPNMHYQSVTFLDTGYISVPCKNNAGAPVPCVFEKYASC